MPGYTGQHILRDPEHETRVIRTLIALKMQLGHKGSRAILGVRSSFDHLDGHTIDKVSFEKWLAANELHMSTHDIDILTSHFDIDGQGHMNIEAFILGMRGNLNERRKAIVLKAFNKADVTGDGKVHVEDIVQCLNVKMMPEVRKGTLTEAEGAKEFVRRLEGTTKMVDSVLTIEDFEDYYSWLSCSIIDDDTFVELIETAWNVSERDIGEDRFALCSRVMIVHSEEKVKGVTDKVKQEQYMRTTLQHFDLENKGALTMEQFLKAAHRMSCSMDENIGQLFFDKFQNENGHLDYYLMAKTLFQGS
mmetsp:Transcript_20254/g.42438  ORF Transcript_20254/g.42438 Transcript_20254/m.42438 type:complete len:305 (-) Transcript_20254:43-957(-)